MEMLFQVVEDTFDLRSHVEQLELGFGEQLFPLFVVRRYHEDCPEQVVQLRM